MKSEKNPETPQGIEKSFYFIFWNHYLTAILKERDHIRVRINTHHFIQQGRGILSLLQVGHIMAKIWGQNWCRISYRNLSFFKLCNRQERSPCKRKVQSMTLGYRRWFTLQARNLALKISPFFCDLSRQFSCIALLLLTLKIKGQNLNCVVYINSYLIPVYFRPRCDSIHLLTTLVFTVFTGNHLIPNKGCF